MMARLTTPPSMHWPADYYESGELRPYAEVARSYPTDKDGRIIGHAARLARIQEMKDAKMEKAGARHSVGDRTMIQKIHDDAVSLGAECSDTVGKSTDNDNDTDLGFTKRHDLSVLKVDDELGLVFGWAIVSKDQGEDYFDVQGDHIPEQSMLKASTEFMLSDRVGKEMHAGDAKGTIVFAWPLTADIAKAMGLETDRTGLMIAWKPHDEATLEKFKSGEFSGFSIGGTRHKDEDA